MSNSFYESKVKKKKFGEKTFAFISTFDFFTLSLLK